MLRSTLLMTMVLFAAPAPALAQSSDALNDGKIFVTTEAVQGYEFPRLIVTAVVNAPPPKVFEVVGNCDRFTERLPRVIASKALQKSPLSYTCEVTINVPFPMSDLTAVTVDRRKLGPDQWYRKWTLAQGVESSYTHNVGGFILSPFRKDPNRTLVRYELHAIPKSAVPDFVRKAAQKKSLPGMIERIREEVAKL